MIPLSPVPLDTESNPRSGRTRRVLRPAQNRGPPPALPLGAEVHALEKVSRRKCVSPTRQLGDHPFPLPAVAIQALRPSSRNDLECAFKIEADPDCGLSTDYAGLHVAYLRLERTGKGTGCALSLARLGGQESPDIRIWVVLA